MIRVILFVAAVVVAVIVAVWFANNPGEVTVMWRGWRIDTSVAILLAIMALVVTAMLGLAKLIAIIRGTAKSLAAARRERRVNQGLKALGYGYAAAHAGQPAAARRYAREAAALLHDNAATHVLQAQAAVANDDAATLRNVALSLLEHPETELAALRDLSARALKEGDVVGALNYAKRALSRKDAPRWAVEIVLDLHMSHGRWADALATLESKAVRDQYDAEAYTKLITTVLTLGAEQALAQGDSHLAESQSRKAVKLGGGERALICHARALKMQGKTREGLRELEKAWNTHPSGNVLKAYFGLLEGEPALEYARRVEKMVSESADHPESRLALAEASLRAQLWGQARNRLSPLLGDDVPRDLHARAAMLMAELETAERADAAAGAQWLKRALDRTTPAALAASSPRSVADILG